MPGQVMCLRRCPSENSPITRPRPTRWFMWWWTTAHSKVSHRWQSCSMCPRTIGPRPLGRSVGNRTGLYGTGVCQGCVDPDVAFLHFRHTGGGRQVWEVSRRGHHAQRLGNDGARGRNCHRTGRERKIGRRGSRTSRFGRFIRRRAPGRRPRPAPITLARRLGQGVACETLYETRLVPPGISSQVRPSNTLPVRFLNTPPHCLKKNGT